VDYLIIWLGNDDIKKCARRLICITGQAYLYRADGSAAIYYVISLHLLGSINLVLFIYCPYLVFGISHFVSGHKEREREEREAKSQTLAAHQTRCAKIKITAGDPDGRVFRFAPWSMNKQKFPSTCALPLTSKAPICIFHAGRPLFLPRKVHAKHTLLTNHPRFIFICLCKCSTLAERRLVLIKSCLGKHKFSTLVRNETSYELRICLICYWFTHTRALGALMKINDGKGRNRF